MSMLDQTLEFFMRQFKVKTKELPAEYALARASELGRFFAVELHYKNQPIRLIVAASQLPDELNPKPTISPATAERLPATATPAGAP